MQLALAARSELGEDVTLVKWRVVGDPNYADHWAVALDAATVLDPTHVQVDGDAGLLWPVSSYPAAFRSMRRYPASLLLDGVAGRSLAAGDWLGPDLLWRCGVRVLRHDLALARRGGRLREAAFAVAEFGRFAWRFQVRRLQRLLERRARRLQGRLAAPDRRSPGDESGG